MLNLEIEARRHGYEPMKPPVLTGRSGVEHRFTFLGCSKDSKFAADVFEEVDERRVLATYIKKYDTGVPCLLVFLDREPGPRAKKLAAEYGIPIMSKFGVEDLRSFLLEETKPRVR
jgi:hypothetical protein